MNLSHVAGAPISWGVCEVPGWGWQMSPERVLAEMAEVGFEAMELGPDGFLPDDGAEAAELLGRYSLRGIGAFLPIVLHRPGELADQGASDAIARLRAVGAEVLVLAASTGEEGYDRRPTLDREGWEILLKNLDLLSLRAADAGITAVLHPHVGTMIEAPPEVERIVEASSIPLCLDTGHLMIGGNDPVDLAGVLGGRVGHVHLKDVDSHLAGRVRAGEVSYSDAVSMGLYRPLGAGDADVSGLVGRLNAGGYEGWYVLEQDAVVKAEPEAGAGPVVDVRASLEFLRGIGDGDGALEARGR